MKDMQTQTVYLIGSRLMKMESVIVRDLEASSLLHFNSQEEAKFSFKHAYNILLAPGFEPQDPSSAEEISYHQEVIRMISVSPVILAVALTPAVMNSPVGSIWTPEAFV